MLKFLVGLALLGASSVASAAWQRAESAHFVVFADADDATIRDAAVRLEKLDVLQRFIAGIADVPIPSARKVKVYLLADDAAVQETMSWPGWRVAGYYNARLRGPIAVNTRTDAKDIGFPAQMVLFHELTHHFMLQYFNAGYPIWYREGLADFIGTATFETNDIARVGEPNANRYYAFQGERKYAWISMAKLLASPDGGDLGDRNDLIYSEGWLLTHYLTLGGTRQGQLRTYLQAINAGRPYSEAAKTAFGDLAALDKELHAYARRKTLSVKLVPMPAARDVPVEITPVGPAQSAMMMLDIRMSSGIPARTAERFANAVRRTAARFPGDPFALRLRAEADRLAGDRDDRALALAAWRKVEPDAPLLLLQTALLRQDQLVADRSTDPAAWDRMRDMLVAAGKARRSDPQILYAYYDSFIAQGIPATAGAQNTLHNALALMPQNDELRFALASDYEKRGMIEQAINTIRPAAYSDDEDRSRSARGKAIDEKARALYRLDGIPFHETPRQMLARLEHPTPAN